MWSHRAVRAGKAGKVWSFPRFWISIHPYKEQSIKKFWNRILDLAWLKFTVAVLGTHVWKKHLDFFRSPPNNICVISIIGKNAAI